jgi:hypothetical protein
MNRYDTITMTMTPSAYLNCSFNLAKIHMAPPLAESRRLLSYNHLFLTPRFPRFPTRGEGVPGPRLPKLNVDSPNELLRVRGDADPKLERCNDSLFGLLPLETAL